MAVTFTELVKHHLDSNKIDLSEFEWLVKTKFEEIMSSIAPKYVWSDFAEETVYRDGYIKEFLDGDIKDKDLSKEFVTSVANVIGISESQLNNTIKVSRLKSIAKSDVKKYNKVNK